MKRIDRTGKRLAAASLLAMLAMFIPAATAQQEAGSAMAIAAIRGGPLAAEIGGIVRIESVAGGTLVTVEVTGLPEYQEGDAEAGELPVGPHGFHVHAGSSCEVGDEENPFMAAEGHFNPDDQPHGAHAGDMPVLIANEGYARMSFFTSHFSVGDVVGRAVIIHESPDDFRSQPAGDAGPRLACGEIVAVE